MKISYYPDHPQKVIVKKNKYYPKGLKEIDIWNYYEGVKKHIIKQTKGGVHVGIIQVLNGRMFVRHPPKQKKYITIENEKDWKRWIGGRTGSIYLSMTDREDKLIVDIDPGPGLKGAEQFRRLKEVTAEAYDFLVKQPPFSRVDILFTGKRGFHLICRIKPGWNTARFRKEIKKLGVE